MKTFLLIWALIACAYGGFLSGEHSYATHHEYSSHHSVYGGYAAPQAYAVPVPVVAAPIIAAPVIQAPIVGFSGPEVHVHKHNHHHYPMFKRFGRPHFKKTVIINRGGW